MNVIYRPRGRALEYSYLACNLYGGMCPHRCSYCYVAGAMHKSRAQWEATPWYVRKDVIKWLERDAERLAGTDERVLLCFHCDPYTPEAANFGVTRQALKVLRSHDVPFQVLTKGGMRAVPDFDLYGPHDAFATTMTFVEEGPGREQEPGAATPWERTKAIIQAHDRGIETWVSLEPVLDPEASLRIIENTWEWVDLYKIGKLNHLRLLQPFDTDKYSTRQTDQVPDFAFLCPEQIQLMKQDLKLLFLYKDHIPRRELINYMLTLIVFHAALYFFQVVKITNHMVRQGGLPPSRGKIPKSGEGRSHAPFELDFFCDMTNGHNAVVDDLAKQRYIEHFKEVEQYFKSAYFMKKLEEFAGSYLAPDQKQQRGPEYVKLILKGYRNHRDLDGYFARDIQHVREAGYDEESKQYNPEVDRIISICNDRKLSRLETFVEILYHFQYGTLREQHRKLIAGLCGTELDRGFMTGRGRAKRKYVIGNELLEVLIQLAVLEYRESDDSWQSRPIPIRTFVDWLRGRYGLLIDTCGPSGQESEKTNRALAANFEALKTRLRQLGFFTDLSDASNSQVIMPRFQIAGHRHVVGGSIA